MPTVTARSFDREMTKTNQNDPYTVSQKKTRKTLKQYASKL